MDVQQEQLQVLPKADHAHNHSLSRKQLNTRQQTPPVIPSTLKLQNILTNIRDNFSVPPPPPPLSLHPSTGVPNITTTLARHYNEDFVEVNNTSSWSLISDISPLNNSSSLSVSSDIFLPDNTSALSGMLEISTPREEQILISKRIAFPGNSNGRPNHCLEDPNKFKLSKVSNPVIEPPAPTTPLPSLGDLFNTAGTSRVKKQSLETSSNSLQDKIVSRDKYDKYSIIERIFAEAEERDNCAWSRCLWTDHHTATCSKAEIMVRCGRDECTWYSKHRDYPICDKLSFYCNCKRLENGEYKYYDDMPQVIKIPTTLDGRRDAAVTESKAVPMRLLYRSISRLVEDPRVSKISYPSQSPQPSALKIFRGEDGVGNGWSQRNVIYPWQALNMGKVKVSTENNPHIVIEDCNSDVEELSHDDIGVPALHV